MKVNSKTYKGIEYIQLNELPEIQQKEILATIDQGETLIKILIDGNVLSNCIQYKDYENWFDSTYTSNVRSVMETTTKNSRSLAAVEA